MEREAYKFADQLMNGRAEYNVGFTQLLGAYPYSLPHGAYEGFASRLPLIRTFQNTCIQLFRDALSGRANPRILRWLLNETPAIIGKRYHRNLADLHFSLPQFFRTDEVTPGRIVEIQCPGSMWGEVEMIHQITQAASSELSNRSPASLYCKELLESIPSPITHYLSDNASAPCGVRFFIESTRPALKYYGIDAGIIASKCNFVRSHSFFGLAAENHFKERLARAANGNLSFDLPPHVLFDQKASLALPFWSLTRDHFSDEVRGILVYSTPVEREGFELEDGTWMTFEQFAQLPHKKRAYYLKYAGSDVALNWGSKAVYRLSNYSKDRCLKLLEECGRAAPHGHIWLIQKAEEQKDNVAVLWRTGEVTYEKMHAKFSGFYGPNRCLGLMAMHRTHNKVHGQENTVVSLVADEKEPLR